jgi:hypothetical protein
MVLRVDGHPIEFIDAKVKAGEALAFVCRADDESEMILPNGGRLEMPAAGVGFEDADLIKAIWVVDADDLGDLIDFLDGFIDRGGDGDTIARLVRIIDRLTED